jgi:hypothetical protein
MLFFSVQNNYHIKLADFFIKKFKINNNEVIFIINESPHYNNLHEIKKKILIPAHPVSSGGGFKSLIVYLKSYIHQYKLKNYINFKKKDTLFILSEYELNNSIFARYVKKNSGKVFLIAESIGFYFNHHNYYKVHEHSFIDDLILKIYNILLFILNIPAIAKKGNEGRKYITIKDKYLDKIFSRFNFDISRNLPIEYYKCISKNYFKNLSKSKNILIFASNFECYGMKYEEVELVKKAIKICLRNFNKVYLKIHPQDYIQKNDVYQNYITINHKNFSIIKNTMTPFEAIKRYKCKYSCGSLSTSLFDSMDYGCQTIFLFHFLKNIKELKVSKIILNKLNYTFINKLNDINLNYKNNVKL